MFSFNELKERSGRGSLQRLQQHIRFDVAQHKKTKLKRVLGQNAERTLLDDAVSAKHAARLYEQFNRRWSHLKTQYERERLRFWTVLDSVVAADPNEIMRAVDDMERRIKKALANVKGVEVIGAAEIEIINLDVLRSQARQSNETETRKLDVIKSMIRSKTLSGSYALVHFHGVVDFGYNYVSKIGELRRESDQIWKGPYRTEIKQLDGKKDFHLSFRHIAGYLCKGGNDRLEYQIGFGRTSVERLERKMMKTGSSQMEPDFEGFENELSLSSREIEVLAQTLERLMTRNGSLNMRNGYLFKHGQNLKGRGL